MASKIQIQLPPLDEAVPVKEGPPFVAIPTAARILFVTPLLPG